MWTRVAPPALTPTAISSRGAFPPLGIVPPSEAPDEVMGNAVAAGGGVVKEAAASQRGYFGYFSDPDGHL
jgi:hypothetical protein